MVDQITLIIILCALSLLVVLALLLFLAKLVCTLSSPASEEDNNPEEDNNMVEEADVEDADEVAGEVRYLPILEYLVSGSIKSFMVLIVPFALVQFSNFRKTAHAVSLEQIVGTFILPFILLHVF